MIHRRKVTAKSQLLHSRTATNPAGLFQRALPWHVSNNIGSDELRLEPPSAYENRATVESVSLQDVGKGIVHLERSMGIFTGSEPKEGRAKP